MKRALLILAGVVGGIVALVGIAIAVVLFVIDPNDYKAEIADLVMKNTDSELAIADRMEWTVWPNIGVKLGKTTLSDPVAKETLVAVDKAAVSVQVMPLFASRIQIDAVSLDGAKVRFIQRADGSTSWDRLLAKLASQPEEKSEKVAFNVKDLDVRNTSLFLKDEKAGVERVVENIVVKAKDIDPDKSFPVQALFDFRQQDAAGKTVLAKSSIGAVIKLDQENQKYDLGQLVFSSDLSGTLLPAPAFLSVKGDVAADMKAQQVQVNALDFAAEYKDPALTAPATVNLKGNVLADLGKQLVKIDGLDAKAVYPAQGLSAPASVSFTAGVLADLAQTTATISTLQLKASWPDAARPSPINAALASNITANWGTGAVAAPQFALNAVLPDKSFPKPLQLALNAPLTANYLQGVASLPAFTLDIVGVRSQGSLEAVLPSLREGTPPDTPVTKGMGISGGIATSTFNPRQVMAALGIAAPKTADPAVLQSASLQAALQGDDSKILLKNIRLKLDGTTLTGDAGISDLATMRLYARLALDRLDADRYLPPATTAAAAAPAAASTPQAAATGLLPVDLLRSQNLDVALSAGGLKVMTYDISNFRLAATAANGLINVSEFRGTVYSGGFSVPMTINVQGAQPVLVLQPTLERMDIGPLASKLLKKELVEGKASYNGKLSLTGNSTDAWMKSVSGDSNLKFENGLLHGVNVMNEVTAALGKYAALLPLLTGKDAATLATKQNDTEIASFAAENTLSNGVVSTKAVNTDLRKAKVAGGGNFNLVTQEIDYTFKLQLDKSVLGDKYAGYQLPVNCKGSLRGALTSLCRLDSRAVGEMVVKAAASKELEKLGIKGGDVKGAVDEKKKEAEAAAQQRIEEEKQKAAEKLNQKIGEGLNKLFNR
ncbi:MAG: AsmA family protein [Gammaproteobacteria bacterium]